LNILQLEVHCGYKNCAVIGGFESMLPYWVPKAKKENVPPEIINVVESQLKHYNASSIEERIETIQNLLVIIGKTGTDSPSTYKSSSAAQSLRQPQNPPYRANNKPDLPKSETTAHNISLPKAKPAPMQSGKVSFFDPKTGLGAPLQTIPSVGPAKSAALAEIGLHTLEDLLYYFPRRYDDYRELLPINRIEYNQTVTVIGSVKTIHLRKARNSKLQITELILEDGTGTLRISFFNQPYLNKQLSKGMQIVVSGRTEMYLGRLAMNNPNWEKLDQKSLFTNRIVPIYKLTKNITQNWLKKVIDHIVTHWAPRVPDYFSLSFIQEADLIDLGKALYEIHNPASFETLARAQQRISFDEIFFLQLGVLQQKKQWQNTTSTIFRAHDEWLEQIYASLPYQLTNAQLKTIADIRKDFQKGIPMSRLVQGDVGSGKTMVAAIAAAISTCHYDSQAAIMAPTSILAEQHYKSFIDFFTKQNLLQSDQICLLIGSTLPAEKEEIRGKLKRGEIKIVIGTHALLEDPVVFHNLEFVVIDEQHRFGVTQRAVLREKGNSPHILVMTATPIPRSLALTVYGDLDISIMDEMPPGRTPVATHIVSPLDRDRVYRLLDTQLDQGRQAFVIYPLVIADEFKGEDETDQPTQAAVNEHLRLQNEIFREKKVGLLHGKMRPEEKESTMLAFKNQEIDIMVSTTVVEVGVDIPNASVMVIE
jgi:ATP-dependent DNA helicase RecG